MEKKVCYVPVSIGELYDKYTILQIKQERIKDEGKLVFINKEIEYLKKHIDTFNLDILLIRELKTTNEILWNVEDNIRDKERRNEFDEEFIALARNVYITNSERSQLKNKINSKLNSELIDIKSYSEY
jgi:hypothetical protein